MFTRPNALSDATILEVVADLWCIGADRAEYAPVGFGSHHWLVGTAIRWEWFVTVDDLATKARSPHEPLDQPFERLEAAFRTVRDLADAGCDFVLAPDLSQHGSVVHRLDERYTVACFPYLDGLTGEDGRFRSHQDRRAVAAHLVDLHRPDRTVAPRCRVEDFELSNRTE